MAANTCQDKRNRGPEEHEIEKRPKSDAIVDNLIDNTFTYRINQLPHLPTRDPPKDF